MIKMKKIKLFVFTLCAMLVSVMSVSAATLNGQYGWSSRTWDSEVNGNTIKLKADSDAGLEVEENETVILDLNGHKLTNWCDGSHCGSNNYSSTIEVKTGGHLTIIDSGTGGKVALASNTKNVSTVVNNGTLDVQAGTFEILSDAGERLSVVYNGGTMNVSGGTFTSNTQNAAAIHNQGTINITGGTITNGVSGSWGLTNNGTANISGGTFTQQSDFSVIQNAGTMTISGTSVFKTNGSGPHNSLITNQNTSGTASLLVEGGDFDAELLFYNDGGDILNITNGHFSDDSNIDTYLVNTIYETDENGNVVLKDADYSGLEGAIAVAKGMDTSKASAESIKALEEAIENAENVEKGLKANEQYKIDELTKALTTAIANLTERTDEVVKPGSDNTDKSDEKAPNTFDAGLIYVGLALSAVGASAFSIKKLKNN